MLILRSLKKKKQEIQILSRVRKNTGTFEALKNELSKFEGFQCFQRATFIQRPGTPDSLPRNFLTSSLEGNPSRKENLFLQCKRTASLERLCTAETSTHPQMYAGTALLLSITVLVEARLRWTHSRIAQIVPLSSLYIYNRFFFFFLKKNAGLPQKCGRDSHSKKAVLPDKKIEIPH